MTVATKERPIIFSAPMVRAILEGRKTQTRRLVKPQPKHRHNGYMLAVEDGVTYALECGADYPDAWPDDYVRSPYPVGTRLWVRERGQRVPASYEAALGKTLYAATCPNGCEPPRWRSPIHMPRWASRITLEVTGVKVERVQDISEADAVAEGMKPRPAEPYDCFDDPREQFWQLFYDLNKRAPRSENPWVWCYTFRRIQPAAEPGGGTGGKQQGMRANPKDGATQRESSASDLPSNERNRPAPRATARRAGSQGSA